MFANYYADEIIAKLRQEELRMELEHDHMVAQAKEGQKSFRLFGRGNKENRPQFAMTEGRKKALRDDS
jgi:hypothetical protein